jgi:hypothetical protein
VRERGIDSDADIKHIDDALNEAYREVSAISDDEFGLNNREDVTRWYLSGVAWKECGHILTSRNQARIVIAYKALNAN